MMASHINELVKMRDIESLFELMTEDDEWLTQLDAAEGLIMLGDRRGYEFLLRCVKQPRRYLILQNWQKCAVRLRPNVNVFARLMLNLPGNACKMVVRFFATKWSTFRRER